MKCPKCTVTIHLEWELEERIDSEDEDNWFVCAASCPSCGSPIVEMRLYESFSNQNGHLVGDVINRLIVFPRGSGRPTCPTEVPKELGADYEEASLILSDSPKASAALSRRCLQFLLRDHANVPPSDLYNEIQYLLDKKTLPSYIAKSLDAVRNIGNFAAHPIKSKHTGEVISVEPGEAEWNLDVLEALFDFYFVQPAELARKKQALNAKLKDAGKQPMP